MINIRIRWWQHPLTLLAWSFGVAIVYALFPSSDMAVIVAMAVWGVGVFAWMIAAEAGD